MTGDSFYRYRSIEKLLGEHKELESQEIYFASPAELNDPMEGVQDVFWEGDHILWGNLIRHYILCLSQAVAFVHIMVDEFRPDLVNPVLQWSASTLPTPMLKEHHDRICAAFLSEPGIADCIKLLARVRTRVRREELGFYFSMLHPIALQHIMARFREAGLVPEIDHPPLPEMLKKTTKNMRNFLLGIERAGSSGKEINALLFESGTMALQQLALIHLCDTGEKISRGWRFLAFEFTEFYCKNIQNTLYPSWYAACFVGSPTHAAMWAHYGDRHEGVCLKFRAEKSADGVPLLRLNGIIGSGYSPQGTSRFKGERKIPLWQVNYAKSFPEIDFFRSLGRLPIPVLNKDWYSDGGDLNDTGKTVFADEAAWRDRYWNNLKLVTTTKFDDWHHENEYRLVINALLENTMEKNERTFTYDFSDLEGIIFGINTSVDDKVRIMKIVEEKCVKSGRKEFEFLQARYSSGTSKFDVSRLSLIKLA